MMPTVTGGDAVSSMTEVMAWLFALVDTQDFDAWRAVNVRREPRTILRTAEGAYLTAQTGLYSRPGVGEVYTDADKQRDLYVEAKHRVDFDFLVRGTCRCWEGGRPDRNGPTGRTAFAKIGYKKVIWQLN